MREGKRYVRNFSSLVIPIFRENEIRDLGKYNRLRQNLSNIKNLP